MIETVFLFLILLQVKHWYIDFVDQSNEEIARKGIYGDQIGMNHSFKHGIGTFICVLIVTGTPWIAYAGIIAGLDALIHYHIDWAKMNYSNRDITTPAFWNHLGLDQMAHQVSYIGYAYLLT